MEGGEEAHAIEPLVKKKNSVETTFSLKPVLSYFQPWCNPLWLTGLKAPTNLLSYFPVIEVPTGSPSRGGDVTVYVKDINQPSLPTPFYSVLVSVSVFMALSTLFHSLNSPDNSPFSQSVLLVLSLPDWSFQLHISL